MYEDRGLKGLRWTVTGELVGSAELWVEPHLDGVVLHHFLRVDRTVPGVQRGQGTGEPTTARASGDSPRQRRELQRIERRYAVSWKAHAWALKDELEGVREPGSGATREPGSGATKKPELPS